MLRVPFYRPSIGSEEIEEVVATLKSGWLTTGPRTKRFENEFAAYVRQRHAIAVNSCTAALHLALEAVGVKTGETVVVPTMTFAATAEVVRYLGARPLLVDCRPEDLNLDTNDAAQKIRAAVEAGNKVRAIMPVHYAGQVADVVGVKELSDRFGLKIIEDSAHCCPAYYRPNRATAESAGSSRKEDETTRDGWLPVGTSADISCYSFYANKTITTGEGGMACTQNDEYADRMRIMSLHGISRDAWKRYTGEGSWYYEILAPGFKYNMADVAAAIGIHQLRKADELRRKRAQLAALYSELLSDIEELTLPREQKDRVHSWHLYVIRLDVRRLEIDRAGFINGLQECGIGTSVHWMPLHMHPYYRETYGYLPEDFPVASAIYPGLVTLPLYPDMSEQEVRFVCDSIRNLIAANLKKETRPLSSSI